MTGTSTAEQSLEKRAYIAPSKSDDWATPKDLYDKLNAEFHFDFDPCPLNANFDGLSIDWESRSFVNPPYSNLKAWIQKSFDESKKGKLVVMLIPARTDTKAFHEIIFPNAEVRFLKGRLKFGDSKNNAPFPSCIVIFGGRPAVQKWN
jgi:hypothetical protein